MLKLVPLGCALNCAFDLDLCIRIVRWIGTIGFLASKNIHLDTRIKSVAAFDPCRFQMAAILKSNMADIKREFQVAQYLKMFATC